MIANPDHPRHSNASPRDTTTGINAKPAMPKRNAPMSQASRLVVTANRVIALHDAQIDIAASPANAPRRYVALITVTVTGPALARAHAHSSTVDILDHAYRARTSEPTAAPLALNPPLYRSHRASGPRPVRRCRSPASPSPGR